MPERQRQSVIGTKQRPYRGEIHKDKNTKFKVNIVPLKIAFLCIPSHTRTGSYKNGQRGGHTLEMGLLNLRFHRGKKKKKVESGVQ